MHCGISWDITNYAMVTLTDQSDFSHSIKLNSKNEIKTHWQLKKSEASNKRMKYINPSNILREASQLT